MDVERAKTILLGILERKLKFRWTAQVRVEVAEDSELLDLMQQSGCETLYMGLESVNPETLKQWNRYICDQYAIEAFERHGIK